MGSFAEEITNSIMDEVEKNCVGVNEKDIYQVLSMVAYRCRTKLDEMEQRPDERRAIYQEQLLKPYH